MHTFRQVLAIAVLCAWPVIPLFWIPAHLLHGFLRKHIGLFSYGLAALVWLPCVWLILKYEDMLLRSVISLPAVVSLAGWPLFAAGLTLQCWTARVMGFVIIGLPEITGRMESRHIDDPPFNLCRHPTYLAHTMIFTGAAMMTGYTALFILAMADMFITRLLIIPFEERELLKRLGGSYMQYMKQTPRFIPKRSRRDPQRSDGTAGGGTPCKNRRNKQ